MYKTVVDMPIKPTKPIKSHFSWSQEDAHTFRIHVKTPETRVGTFHRLTAAIYALNFDILSGKLATVTEDNEIYSDDVFLIQSQRTDNDKNAALADSLELGSLMEAMLHENKSLKNLFEGKTQKPPENRLFFELPPEIVFEDDQEEKLTQFYIETLGRRGLLYNISRILYEENVNIIQASIETTPEGVAEDTFFLQHNNACLTPELSQHLADRILKDD